MAFVYLLCSGLLLIAGTNAALLGIDWIYLFQGLNPWIAFPIALGCIAAGIGCGLNGIRELQE